MTCVGDLMFVRESTMVPVKGNTDGRATPAYSDDLRQVIFFLQPDTAVVVTENPAGRYIKVMSSLGSAWVESHRLRVG